MSFRNRSVHLCGDLCICVEGEVEESVEGQEGKGRMGYCVSVCVEGEHGVCVWRGWALCVFVRAGTETWVRECVCGYCDVCVGMCGERLGCSEGEKCLCVEEEMG